MFLFAWLFVCFLFQGGGFFCSLRLPFDSILEAVLTVSPKRQYLGIFSPTTPATHGPGKKQQKGTTYGKSTRKRILEVATIVKPQTSVSLKKENKEESGKGILTHEHGQFSRSLSLSRSLSRSLSLSLSLFVYVSVSLFCLYLCFCFGLSVSLCLYVCLSVYLCLSHH